MEGISKWARDVERLAEGIERIEEEADRLRRRAEDYGMPPDERNTAALLSLGMEIRAASYRRLLPR